MLFGLILLASIALPKTGAGEALLVGARGATLEQVRQTVASHGEVGAKNSDGFFEVRLKESSARQDLKSKFTYVFDASASTVDTDSLPSLRRHIEFLRARRELLATGAEFRTTAGFYEALAHYLEPRVGPDGTIDQDAVMRAIKHREQMPPAWVGTNSRAPSSTFTYVGPKNLGVPYLTYFGSGPVSGRVNGIAYAKSNPNIVYLATAGAGVWRSTDQGANWTFRSQEWPFLHTNSVAVHPSNANVVIVGTGDYKGFFGAQTMGMMRSTDGGLSWAQVAKVHANKVITRVMFHPDNPSIVLALTNTAQGKILRSTDAGVTWTETSAPDGRWDDIDYGPVNSRGTRQIWAVGGNGEAGGRIVMSTDAGLTWSTIADATTTAQTILDIACSKRSIGKVWVLHPNNNTIFRTTNSGTSWTNLLLTSNATFPNHEQGIDFYNWAQDTYDAYVETAVVGDTELLYCGLITLAFSTDDGGTWTDLSRSFRDDSRMHVDQHCFTPHPTDGWIGLAGNDGGVYRVVNVPGSGSTLTSLNATLQATQHYHVSVHPTDSNYIMAGAQDNATSASRGNLSSWAGLWGGDGSWSAFEPGNPSIHYTSSQFARVYRYPSSQSTSVEFIRAATNTNTAFISPLVVSEGNRLLVGAQTRIQRWNGGTSWLSSNDFAAVVRQLAVAHNNRSRIYAGGSGGLLRVSTDNGVTFGAARSTPVQGAVGAIAPSWENDLDILVGIQSPTGGLFRCKNFDNVATPFTNVAGVGATGLPASPINAIIRDPWQLDVWYVGTDVGAFMTTNGGQTWTNMNVLGLGNVHVNAFAIPSDKSYLYVATFGRGIWRIPLVNNRLMAFELDSEIVFGDRPVTATVRLSHPAPVGTTVKLATASPHVLMPASIDFPAGATQHSFSIETRQVFSTNKVAILFATCMGETRTIQLILKPYPTIASMSVPRNYMYGGTGQYLTVNLSAPAPFVGSISFIENSAFLSAVTPITIGTGETSKMTSIVTSNPTTMQTVTITAAYKGTTRTLTVYVYPMPVIKSVSTQPIPLIGGFVGMATVTLTQAAPITTEIGISESSPYITMPGVSVLQAFQTSLNIPVYSINPLQNEIIGFNARIVGDPAAPKSGSIDLRRSQLTSLSVSPNPISSGKKSVLTVIHNLPLPVSRVISLSSSNPAVASVPVGVTMLAGSASATATVTTYSVAQSTTTTLTASFNGTTRQTTLTVNP